MGVIKNPRKAFKRDAQREMWGAFQALAVIATGDESLAEAAAGWCRRDLEDLGQALGCAMDTLRAAARCFLPSAPGYAQHGVRTFGTPWSGGEGLAQINPETLAGLRLLFGGEHIVFGLPHQPEWGDLHFFREEVVRLARRVRSEAKAEARRRMRQVWPLRADPWLSLADAIRATMMVKDGGRARLAALCPFNGPPPQAPPSWSVYLLGSSAAEAEQARAVKAWSAAQALLLGEMVWGRRAARGEIDGVRSDVPAEDWSQLATLHLGENRLGARTNLSVQSPFHFQADKPKGDTKSSAHKSQLGRPKEYNKTFIQEIGRKFVQNSSHLHDHKITQTAIADHIRDVCVIREIKCPERSTLLAWVREIQ